MTETYSLQEDLDDVRRQLRDIQTAIDSGELSLVQSIPLRTALLNRVDTLEKALNPNPPIAPPGNSISLPQLLPHSSIAFPFFVLRPSVPPPPRTIRINYKICERII